MADKTLIMKFGGASVATPERFERIAEIIVSRRRDYPNIVVVVSAMGNTTNDLISLAKRVHPQPPQREYDMLVSVGERISISLLAMALEKKGQVAKSFTGSQSGIITTNTHTNAEITDIKPHRLIEPLNNGSIVIVAGFQGVSQTGEITTLGRGGSDTTAVALAVALKASKVEFYKDVCGVCEKDPKINQGSTVIPKLSYKEAMDIVKRGAKVLNHRCLALAEKNSVPLHVRSFENDFSEGTIIISNRVRSNTPSYELACGV